MKQIQKADLCFSRWLLLMTGFSVSMLLRGMAIENNWLGDASLKDYRLKQKIKLREMKTK